MREYVTLSLETHLFFSRIMKEHSFFLLASFPTNESNLRQQAECFQKEFEDGLRSTLKLANGFVGNTVLTSGEIVTKFTKMAECQTQNLTGLSINTELTETELCFRSECSNIVNRETVRNVKSLNRQMLQSLNGLIAFKEEILQKVLSCKLYTTNYPLLIEHILREAKLYRRMLMQLERRGRVFTPDLWNLELFWNQIMMEHAQFIRGLLDPTECKLIGTANGFAEDYSKLLEEAKKQDAKAINTLTAKTLQTTKNYQQFKTAGVEGITGCQIRSVILPLLADHVLREANHYLRILEHTQRGADSCGAM